MSTRQKIKNPKNIILSVFVNCLFECLCHITFVESLVFLATPHKLLISVFITPIFKCFDAAKLHKKIESTKLFRENLQDNIKV